MQRRNLFVRGAAITTAVLVQATRAAEPPESHAEHHHAGAAHASLVSAASACVRTGEICQAHCFDLLAGGDRSISDCNKSVAEMLAVTQALTVLAAQDSAFLGSYAKVAAEVCKYCEDACRKHAARHVVCKDCADACATCARECQAVAT